MSEEQLKAFIAKVQADTSLQEQLKEEGADVVAIAKEEGFSISADDLQLKKAQNEISDEALEGLAGGGATPTQPPPPLRVEPALRGKRNLIDTHSYHPTTQSPAIAGAFDLLNYITIRLKRHPIHATIDLQKVALMSYLPDTNQK